jgi:hypothetical protein
MIGIQDLLRSPSSAITSYCKLFAVISGGLITLPMSLCENAGFRQCWVNGFDIFFMPHFSCVILVGEVKKCKIILLLMSSKLLYHFIQFGQHFGF